MTDFIRVSPQATMYATRDGLLTWWQYILPKKAAEYRVLRPWWCAMRAPGDSE